MRVKALKTARTDKNLRVVLAGNPNAGKTTLFNSLTRSSLRTGNFHGVTTTASEKKRGGITYVDSPGLYAMNAYSMEENCASEELKGADLIVNVCDALTLVNSLNLTHRLISVGKPVVMYVTKSGQLKRRGGRIDKDKLSSYLGIPVFICSPKQLKRQIENGINFNILKKDIPQSQFYSAGREGVSRADKLFYNCYFASFFFVCAIALMFFLAFHPLMIGAYLKGLTETLIVDKLGSALTSFMQNEILISLVRDGILGGAGSVLSFIPQLAVLYLFLTLLDESGIMSALSFATDGLFEKVNLSGRTAFSLVSGFGCTAAAIMTTRGYSTESAQKRTVAILPFIPCGAKLPVFLTFLSPLFKNPFPVITLLYFSGLGLSLLVSLLLKGGKEGMLSEVTPIILPSANTVLKKLYFYLKGFIIKVAGIITLFCLISWFFSHFSFSFEYVPADKSMLSRASRIILPLFYPMGVTDWRIAYSVLCGFIAKENVAATIAMLIPDFTVGLGEAISLCTFMLLCPACISAVSASVKETGLKFTLKCFTLQLIIAFSGAFLIHLLFL